MALTSGQMAFVAAMLSLGSVPAAAAAIHVGERTAWRWMALPQVKAELAGSYGDLLGRLSDEICGKVGGAIQVLVEIMNDKNEKASVRVSAASTVVYVAARVAAIYGTPAQSGEQITEFEAIVERLRLRVESRRG